MKTQQLELWRSRFGLDYAQRSQNAVDPENQRRLMRDWGRMLNRAISPRPISALEVGCNIGRNLHALRSFIPELHALEPNSEVLAQVRADPSMADVTLHEGDGFSLPYPENSIDLVFTSGVLIHIAPDDLAQATQEIVRVARHYVLAIEYFSHTPEAISYRGMEGYLFKRDFGLHYMEHYPSLNVVDYGFLWKPIDSGDNTNWWLFAKREV